MIGLDNTEFEILIADDNKENLKVLSEILKSEGYKIRIAQNGNQALASIRVSRPDLLLLDVHMPEVDGFTVSEKLHQEDNSFPVIFISALNDTFNKMQAFKTGAVDYITKPFEMEEVKARIKIHLQLNHYVKEVTVLRTRLKEQEKEIERLKDELYRHSL